MNNYDDIKRFKEKLNMESIDYKEIAESNPNSSASSWTIIRQIVNADRPFHPLEQGHSTLPPPSPISQQEFSARPSTMAEGPARHAYGPPALSPLFNAVENALPPQTATGSAPPLGAIDGNRAANRPGSVFDQLTRQPGADTRALQTARALAPTEGHALPLQGRAALFADIPPSGFATDDQAQKPGAPPFAQAPAHTREAFVPSGSPFTAQHEARSAPLFRQMQDQSAHTQAPARTREAYAPQSNLFAVPNAPQDIPGSASMRFKNLFNRSPAAPADSHGCRDVPLSLLLENIALCR